MNNWITTIVEDTAKENYVSRFRLLTINEVILPGTDLSTAIDIKKDVKLLGNNSSCISPRIYSYFISNEQIKNWYLTNTFTITQQLDNGIRYFKIKISCNYENSNQKTWYATNVFTNIELSSVLEEFDTWLNLEGNNDFILIDFELEPCTNKYYNKEGYIDSFYDLIMERSDNIYKPEESNKVWEEAWKDGGEQYKNDNTRLQGDTKKGYIKLPTVDEVKGLAVIFVDKKLYSNDSETKKQVSPLPSFLFINQESDDYSSAKHLVSNRKKWLRELKSRTSKIAISYNDQNYKFIDSVFNKLNFYYNIPNIDIQKQIALIILIERILLYLPWLILSFLIISFVSFRWGIKFIVDVTICPSISYILLKFFVICLVIALILTCYLHFWNKKKKESHSNKIASTIVNAKLDELLNADQWNKRNLSIITLNYPTVEQITKIRDLNCYYRENTNPSVNDPIIWHFKHIDEEDKPNKLKIKIRNVAVETDGKIVYQGKLKYTITSDQLTPDTRTTADDDKKYEIYDDDLQILDKDNVTKTTDGIFEYENDISLNNLKSGKLRLTIHIENSCENKSINSATQDKQRINGVDNTIDVILPINDEKFYVKFEDFTDISPMIKNSTDRLIKFYQTRQS